MCRLYKKGDGIRSVYRYHMSGIPSLYVQDGVTLLFPPVTVMEAKLEKLNEMSKLLSKQDSVNSDLVMIKFSLVFFFL